MLYLFEKNPHISGPAQFKLVLFKVNNSSYNCGGNFLPPKSFTYFLVAASTSGTLIMTCHVTLASHQWEVGFCRGLQHIPKAPSSLLSLILCHLTAETDTASGQCISRWELFDQLILSRTLIYLLSDHLFN